jgi:hypothetical protein
MSEDEPSDKERAEAEALARALDGEAAPPAAAPLPLDALETAALLRQRELSAVAAERVLAHLTPALRRKRYAMRIKVFAAAATLLAASSAALLVWRKMGPAPAVVSATALPLPSAALLAAQARAPTDAQALDEEMRRYRGSLYGALSARYP